ncbi:DNA polymerase III subunit alpha [Miniphocaeibacter massiliensis]|uniref:DNA polymerase III subunit alpha n=1 Tax=Miniphocaeibacter massiliensis TaxID=2041841 RepID=UPI000C1BE097|nr:DNA polymerase III subunit alpha [Miniphocaeibacter massiliensis]
MNREFTHLHVHTEYSLLDGFSPIKKLLDYAKELNMKSMAITDHGSMFGVVQFYKEAKKRGIKPIIGCEIYTVNNSYLEKTNANKRYNHLILFAENQVGYKNLMEIVSLGYINGFYYKPRVDKDILRQYSEGIIALSACLKGEVSENLVYDDYDKAKKIALELEDIFGKGNFFLELQNHGMEQDKIILEKMPKLSKETGIPMVATNDIHYIKKDDWRIHDILLCIQLGKTIQEKNEGGMHYAPGEFYLRTASEMYELFEGYEEALENTNKIAERCNVELDFGTLHLPYFEIPKGYTNKEYLREISTKGLINRYDEVNEKIKSRLEFELKTIEDMGFVDYFLIVSDFIRFAKSKNIPVGPGRGSAAGSIVSYALGITDIDPLKYDLLFERFLNPERVSMPDIDIDFCYERREEVIDYVIDKYGEDKVAQIVTFGTMAARGAIRDVGRVLDMEYNRVDEVAKKVPMMLNMTIDKALDMSPEFKQLYDSDEEVKNLIDIANAVEGMPRHTSTHAAGVVISKKPVVEYVPLARNKDSIITQFNMIELEELGLLKMDFLGLRTLTVIQDAVDLVNRDNEKKISIEDMDENDSEVLAMFTVAETLGIFQFESAGMRAFLRELKPTKFDDLVAANSLFRPGPMNEIPTYIYNKNHIDEIRYLHPLLEPILNVTYGTIVYQEQVMQIVQQLAGYSLGAADNLRRAMGKKKMDVMEAERKKFIHGEIEENGNILTKGAVKNGVPEDVANKIYDLMIDFAKYAFNKSHSAAYSLVAMRTAWLKHYYPVEFMAALLSSIMGNTSQVALYIQECRRLNIEILQPDVNYSFKKFDVQNGKIRFGLSAVKNVGEALINTIVESRKEEGEFENFRDFVERIVKKNPLSINKRAIECLIKAGAFSSMDGTKAGLMVEYSSVIDSVQSAQKKNIPGQASLFDLFKEDDDVKTNSEISYKKEYEKKDLLKQEKEVLGIYLSDHPMRPYEDLIEKYSDFSTLDLKGDQLIVEEKWDKKSVTIVGIVESVNKKFTKNNKIMEFVKFEDLFGSIELTVFPNMYERYSNIVEEDNVLMVKGILNISERDGANIIVSSIKGVEGLVNNLENTSKKLFIKIPKEFDEKLVDDIKSILERTQGRDIVNIYFEESKKAYKLSDKYCVDVNNKSILSELEKYVGLGNIKIV